MTATILVIDDSEDDQLLYQRAFKEFDCFFHLLMTSSAEAGLASAIAHKPALILLDFNLPDLDGLGFMKKLAAHSDTAIPIVMLTGESSAAVAVEVMKHGADDYLVKDTEGRYLRLLPGVVGRVIAAHTQREEAQRLRQQTEALLLRNQTLMQNSMDGIHVMDMQGNIVEANDAFCRMLGYSKEEMSFLNVADFDAQWSAEELQERIKQLIGNNAKFETVHRRKDGTLIDVEISTSGMEIEGQGFLFAASRDITERKRADAVLRQHKQVIEASIDGFWMTDIQGNILEANAAYTKLSGYSVEELEQMHVSQLEAIELKPEDVHAHIAKVVAQGYDRFETRHLHKDGHEIDIEISVNYMEESQRLFVFCRDITERKKTERELLRDNATERRSAEELAQQFGQLLQSSFNEIYIFDADSLKFILTSEGAEKNLGYSDEELKQLTPLDLETSYTRENFESRVEPLRNGKLPSLLFETTHRRKDGSIYPVEVRLQLMPAESPVFLAIIQDIAERRAAEEGLRLHSNILKNMAEGVYLIRADDGVIVFTNSQFDRIFGYESGELVGQHVSIVNASDQSSPEAAAKAITDELVRTGMWRGEVQNIRKDGAVFWCHASVSTLEHSQFGTVWVSVHEDISERKYAEQQARELSAHLQTIREEEKASFAREIHDDLGATLTALKMDASWLASKLAEKKGMRPLQECAKSMAGLLDNAVLATRRIITDLRPSILDELGLIAVLKWQCAEFQKRTSIQCRCDCSEDESLEDRLNKVQLINLFRISQEALTNIARHSGASKVKFDLHQDGNNVVLSIIDNGRGMSEGQIVTSASYGLRGMRERVAQMDGNIKFETPSAGGFCVTVKLPLVNSCI